MIVYFRVDAAPSIGIGHYMRCIALAQAIKSNSKSKDWTICFVSKLVPESIKLEIANQKFLLQEISGAPGSIEDALALRALVEKNQKCLLVLDGYQFDQEYKNTFSKRHFKLFLFEDFAPEASHDADFVLHQSIGVANSKNSEHDIKGGIKLFYGEKFILLRKEFWSFIGKRKSVNKELNKVLVTIGGSDVGGVLQLVYRVFLKMKLPLEICLVTGSTNSRVLSRELALERENNMSVRIIESTNQISELMTWSDLAICGGGSTTWELVFLGIPFMAVSANEAETANLESLCALGLGSHIGNDNDASEDVVHEQFEFWRCNYELRLNVATKGPQIIDGKGFERICNELLEQIS